MDETAVSNEDQGLDEGPPQHGVEDARVLLQQGHDLRPELLALLRVAVGDLSDEHDEVGELLGVLAGLQQEDVPRRLVVLVLELELVAVTLGVSLHQVLSCGGSAHVCCCRRGGGGTNGREKEERSQARARGSFGGAKLAAYPEVIQRVLVPHLALVQGTHVVGARQPCLLLRRPAAGFCRLEAAMRDLVSSGPRKDLGSIFGLSSSR